MTGQPEALVMYRLGGESYPMVSDPRCKTCRSAYRLHIESEVIAARPIGMIIEAIRQQDSTVDISVHSIRNHIDKHMPAKHATMRRMVERRAEERGKAVDEGLDNLVTGLAAAEAIVQKGYEALLTGRLPLKARDVLAAAKLLEDYEGDGLGLDEAMFVEAFMVYHEGAQRFMSEEQFRAFGQYLNENEALARLQERWEQIKNGEPRTVQGSVERTALEGSLTEDQKAG